MKTVELIVGCNGNCLRETQMNAFGHIKYFLPMINAYVVEVPENQIGRIKRLKGVTYVTTNTQIAAQMQETRKVVIGTDTAETDEYTGKGITIAILDTGVAPVDDLCLPDNRIIAFKDFLNNKQNAYDDNAHGTHVAGIAAGNGYRSEGRYRGMAPEANIVAVKILDAEGKGNAADVLAGLQWVMDNREKYNIRIVNLSIGTLDVGSTDPLVRAVEYAWDQGVVVVVAAGNNGPDYKTVTSPGISRKVITVGASDDHV